MKSKKLRHFTILLILITVYSSSYPQKKENDPSDLVKADQLQSKPQRNFRYAYSCDGFNQDRDDVAGSAEELMPPWRKSGIIL